MLDQLELKKILPQAYPFLLIDRVENVQPGQSLLAIKNITADEWPLSHCREHMPHYPETLLIEAAAQAALVLYRANQLDSAPSPVFIGKVKAEFFSSVYTGDKVSLNVKSSRAFGTGGYSDVEVLVDTEKKAEITVFYSIPKA
jgi:3-hydroxyacyl-[acyl-carrier-protein] dehydratase